MTTCLSSICITSHLDSLCNFCMLCVFFFFCFIILDNWIARHFFSKSETLLLLLLLYCYKCSTLPKHKHITCLGLISPFISISVSHSKNIHKISGHEDTWVRFRICNILIVGYMCVDCLNSGCCGCEVVPWSLQKIPGVSKSKNACLPLLKQL